MTALVYGSETNLEELRSQLTGRVVLLVAISSSLLVWLRLFVWVASPRQPFPVISLGLLALFSGIGWGLRALCNIR